MHDVAVALDGHEVGHANASVFRDAADIVAGQIDEHEVLGTFLRIVEQFLGVVVVLLGVGSAADGAGDGTDLDMAFVDADVDFG